MISLLHVVGHIFETIFIVVLFLTIIPSNGAAMAFLAAVLAVIVLAACGCVMLMRRRWLRRCS